MIDLICANYNITRNSNNNLIFVDDKLLNLSDLTIDINRKFNINVNKREVLLALNSLV